MATHHKPTSSMLTAGFLGVIMVVVAPQPISDFLVPVESRPQVAAIPVKLPPSPEEVARPHLKRADEECERIIDEHVKAINRFFADSKKHTRGFSEEALGWSSKWRLAADYVPFTNGDRHQKFIRGKFEERIFTPYQLEQAIRQVVASYLKHVESIEGKMLVSIRADVEDFPAAYLINQIDESKVKATYNQALARAIEAAGSNLRADVATELVSIITGEILTQIAIRLGVSAGILGTGAATSWATFGIGVVVGLIVDQIVSWVWDWYADPKGNLAAELNKKLDEINRLIVDGSNDVQGLRVRLRQFAKQRAAIRSQAVLSILQPQK